MQDLAEALSTARQPTADPTQQTLHDTFGRQTAEAFQIHTGSPTAVPEPVTVQAQAAPKLGVSSSLMDLSPQTHSSVGEAVDMILVGETLGHNDKRKRSESESEEQGRGGRPQSPKAPLGVQAQASVSAVEESAQSFSSHDTLRKHLMAQSHKQAQQRKARAMKLREPHSMAKLPKPRKISIDGCRVANIA